jgi:hypothetical protein
MALDRGKAPHVVAEADGVEGVQRVRAEAKARADRRRVRARFELALEATRRPDLRAGA